MSDQSKPTAEHTLDECRDMGCGCREPKPTGEWTGDDDGVILPMHRFVGQYAKEIAATHNAALAAERERSESTTQRMVADAITYERKQAQAALAAETQKLTQAIINVSNELAAERKKHEETEEDRGWWKSRYKIMEQQLDTAVEALKWCADSDDYEIEPVVNAALAKIGGK